MKNRVHYKIWQIEFSKNAKFHKEPILTKREMYDVWAVCCLLALHFFVKFVKIKPIYFFSLNQICTQCSMAKLYVDPIFQLLLS